MSIMQNIKLLGIPFHFGQRRPGVKFAPEVLRKFGLLQNLEAIAPVKDCGNLIFNPLTTENKTSVILNEEQSSLYNWQISEAIENENLEQSFLFNLGGDHGMALGTIHGILSHRPDTVVVWADAHGDINTPESSPSGNFHGMPLAFLLGEALRPQHFKWFTQKLRPQKLILFGPRDLDQGELDIIEKLGIQYYSSSYINKFGSQVIIEEALKKADPEGVCPIHLSFDVDIFDADDVFATGTRVSDGPRSEEVFLMGETLAATGRLQSMDVVEVNPTLGTLEESLDTLNLTVRFATMVIEECFEAYEKKGGPKTPGILFDFLDHTTNDRY